MKQNEKIPFVFLTSHAFSGSTLTSFLMGTHPDIATVGELTGPAARANLQEYPCSCGRKFQEDPFWQAVAAAANRHGLTYSLNQYLDTRFDLGNSTLMQRLRSQSMRNPRLEVWRDWMMFHLWPGHQKALDERVRRNEIFVQAILEVTGKSIFLDTSKDPMRIRYLQRSSLFDLYVIHLVRDVRGVVASVLSRKPEMNVRQAAKSWLIREQNIQGQLQAIPADRKIQISYEELTHQPLTTLNRLYAFMGAETQPQLLDYREVEHHILGNKMRKRSSSEIQTDERWRTALTTEQLQAIEQVVGSPGLAVQHALS
jgi:hypothetical protein